MTSVAQRLRQKLLDLAIHGKLVPQNPKDEPAGELLARIRKVRSAVGGRARTPAAPLSIPEEELPFDLPRGWVWCRLGDVCNVLAGFPFDSKKYVETGIKICGGLIIMPDKIKWHECKHWPGSSGYEAYLLQKNDVVVALDRPWITGGFKVGIVTDSDLPALLIQRTARLRSDYVEADYLVSLLSSDRFRLFCDPTGTTVPHISHTDILNFPIPLPPLAEQKRIVEKLNAMLKEVTRVAEGTERLAQLRKKARAKILDLAIRGKLVKQEESDEPASELLKRIAAEKAKLVAEKKIKKEKPLPPIAEDEIPFDLPKGWTWARLGSVLRVINVGIVIKPTRYYTNNDGIMAFRNSNVGEGFVDRRNWVQISHKGTEENPRCVLHEGDIAIARSGKPGVACPITKEFEGFAAIDILIATPFADFVDDEYLCFCINNSTAQRVILGMNRGIAQSHIGATSIVNLPIPLPPLDEQRRIVAKVKVMLAASDVLKKGD